MVIINFDAFWWTFINEFQFHIPSLSSNVGKNDWWPHDLLSYFEFSIQIHWLKRSFTSKVLTNSFMKLLFKLNASQLKCFQAIIIYIMIAALHRSSSWTRKFTLSTESNTCFVFKLCWIKRMKRYHCCKECLWRQQDALHT